MKADTRQSVSPADSSVSSPRSQARRRLLRGSFAAPTVLTLSSGSALAASSSLRCFANSPTSTTTVSENYFRAQRYTVTVDTTTYRVVKCSEIKNLVVPKGIDPGVYTTPDALTEVWMNAAGSTVAAVSVPPSVVPQTETGVFVALRLTNTGTDAAPRFKVTGLAKDSTSMQGEGKLMTSSCWGSFA